MTTLYLQQGQRFEEEGKWGEAEKMHAVVEGHDRAIAIYKKCGHYDSMIRLVTKHRAPLLKETHLAVAQKLHKDGNLKIAEQHYLAAGTWRTAVDMYRAQSLWEDAVRCSKLYGKDDYTCELAKKWAETLGP